jgi:hypothetical protein
MYIIIFAKECSRSDWGSNPRPTATPPSTTNALTLEDFVCSNPGNLFTVYYLDLRFSLTKSLISRFMLNKI